MYFKDYILDLQQSGDSSGKVSKICYLFLSVAFLNKIRGLRKARILSLIISFNGDIVFGLTRGYLRMFAFGVTTAH